MYYFPYIVLSGTPSSAQIKLESQRTQIPLCICIIFDIAWKVMNVRNLSFFQKLAFFENQLKRDIYTQV